MNRFPMVLALVTALVVSAATAIDITPASAASAVQYGVGSTSLASPSTGGRYLYVATTGTDSYKQYSRVPCLRDPSSRPPYQDACPEPTASAPLRTVQAAVRSAHAGDVIVVRSGTYAEAIGWGIERGTSARPIVLQAAPGERVQISGTLIMTSPDYWTVQGIRFVHNAAVQKDGQAVVLVSGGVGWTFRNNEVTGSTGVANLLVNATTTSGTTSALRAAAPRDFEIAGNCIHDNRATGTQGTDHNIYLMSSIYSTGGVIERNLIAGAPRGSNIKAAGSTPSTANGSPRNVSIRYNTMLAAASGLTIGLKAQGVVAQRNVIALPAGSGPYDGAVKTYQLATPAKNAATDSLLSGYARPVSEDYGVSAHLFTARNNTKTAFSYTGSIANCTARASSATVLANYGQYAG